MFTPLPPRLASPSPPGPPVGGAGGLVPIRVLTEQSRPALLRHLLALASEDRHLRFGHAASDRQIARYVRGIDFGRDEVFGVFDRDLELIAVAHLALSADSPGEAELGVSVLPRGRGRGIGTRLFERAATFARNRGLHTLRLQCLSRNEAMMRIARRAGMLVCAGDGEAEATLQVPPRSLLSHFDAWLRDMIGELDFALKRRLRRPLAARPGPWGPGS